MRGPSSVCSRCYVRKSLRVRGNANLSSNRYARLYETNLWNRRLGDCRYIALMGDGVARASETRYALDRTYGGPREH